MKFTKAQQKAYIDREREEELREYDERLAEHDFIAVVRVPLSFKGGHIKPAIQGTEHLQGWSWLLSYWDVEENEPWVKVGIYQEKEVGKL